MTRQYVTAWPQEPYAPTVSWHSSASRPARRGSVVLAAPLAAFECHRKMCADNFFTGTKDNIAHLLPNPHFDLMRHDVTFPLFVEVDEIYNLACPASPVHYQHDPVQTTKTSVHGAINMLGLAKRVKAKILQASTSEVYGDPKVHPQTEDYWGNVNPIGIRSCYDEGKRCARSAGTRVLLRQGRLGMGGSNGASAPGLSKRFLTACSLGT